MKFTEVRIFNVAKSTSFIWIKFEVCFYVEKSNGKVRDCNISWLFLL